MKKLHKLPKRLIDKYPIHPFAVELKEKWERFNRCGYNHSTKDNFYYMFYVMFFYKISLRRKTNFDLSKYVSHDYFTI